MDTNRDICIERIKKLNTELNIKNSVSELTKLSYSSLSELRRIARAKKEVVARMLQNKKNEAVKEKPVNRIHLLDMPFIGGFNTIEDLKLQYPISTNCSYAFVGSGAPFTCYQYISNEWLRIK